MFIEFFTRAVQAGLITESQKEALMDFAKSQPVTSFVASRPPVTPEGEPVPSAAHNLATTISRTPPADAHETPIPRRARTSGGTDWLGVVLLVLVTALFTGWAVGYDAGPAGHAVRTLLESAQQLATGSSTPAASASFQ